MLVRIILAVAGVLIVLHDILYHLGFGKPLGKEVKVLGLRIHHAYIGIMLVLLALLLPY